MSHIYLVVKEQGLENPKVAYVSAISCEGFSLDRMLLAEKIEHERLEKEFPIQNYSITQLLGGKFADNSPEAKCLEKNKSEFSVQQILGKEYSKHA